MTVGRIRTALHEWKGSRSWVVVQCPSSPSTRRAWSRAMTSSSVPGRMARTGVSSASHTSVLLAWEAPGGSDMGHSAWR